MRKLFYGAAAVACLGAAGPALANGVGGVPVVVEPVPVWGGCYAGGNLGGAWTGDDDAGDLEQSVRDFESEAKAEDAVIFEWERADFFEFNEDNTEQMLFGGLHAGCNWEHRAWVYGLEADIGFGDNIDYLASIRGRVGTTWDSWHVFLTGGFAFVGFDRGFSLRFAHEQPEDPLFFTRTRAFDNQRDESGYVVGVGFEKLISLNMSVGLEGLYYWFHGENDDYDWVAGTDDHFHRFRFDQDNDNDVFVLRARFSYHLRPEPHPVEPLK